MKILFQFKCNHCESNDEYLVTRDVYEVRCKHCSNIAKRIISTPAFRFANGTGTDMGSCMSIPGQPLPSIT